MLCFEAHRNQSLGEGTCPKDCEGADPKIPPLQQSWNIVKRNLTALEYLRSGPASWKIVVQNNSCSVKSTNEVNIP